MAEKAPKSGGRAFDIRTMKYEYDICTIPDKDIFFKQCSAIEKSIPAIEKGDFLEDVDGTMIQCYSLDKSDVLVVNDALLGVIVKSEQDIKPYFKAHREVI